jgi:hypothetical protein
MNELGLTVNADNYSFLDVERMYQLHAKIAEIRKARSKAKR